MQPNQSIPYLSEQILSGLGITTNDVVARIIQLIHQSQKDEVWSAPKAVIMPSDGRYMMAALAAMDQPSLLAVKTVVLNPRNTSQGLPQINGLVTLLSSETGLPRAIIDGNWITAVRTAGLSAVAAKYLARKEATSIGFIGAGVQARSHLQAFSDLFPLRRVKVSSRGRENIDQLGVAAGALGLEYEICHSPQAAIEDVDLVVTSVTGTGGITPFLDASWLAPGCFATVTDLGAPWHKQSFARLDRLIVDDLEQEKHLPNKLADPTHISGDLAQLVLGQCDGRRDSQQRTAFVFRGYALGDLALSVLAYEKFIGSA